MRLDRYSSAAFNRGRPAYVEAFWMLAQALFVSSWLPGSRHRVMLLRLFGADIGREVVIKPGVYVKFPWRLSVGDFSWIGEQVRIDNLGEVRIGSHCCISQKAYLCTGNHDWKKETFDLIVKPIVVENHAWVGAATAVAPGVRIGVRAVLSLGGVATSDLRANWVHAGVPATPLKPRTASVSPVHIAE